MFAVLKDVASFKRNALYLRLMRKPDGVAVGRTAMPFLPSSRRQVLLDAGRSDVTPFISATTKEIPTGAVMEGAADFQITVDAEARVETVTGRVNKAERPSAPTARPEEPQPKKPAAKSDKPEKPDKPEAPVGGTEPG
jgi:hypothetical protein